MSDADCLGPGVAGAPRTLSSTAASVIATIEFPDADDTFFGDCVANTPGTGTPLNSEWANRLLQQIRRVIRNAGQTINSANDDMLWDALQRAFLPVLQQTVFYVAPGGNDANPGTSGSPFGTPQGAVNAIAGFFYPGAVTINVAAGTYTSAAGATGFTIPNSLIGNWVFVGAGASTTIIDASATGGRGISVAPGQNVTISGFTFKGYYEAAQLFGAVLVFNCNFGLTGATSYGIVAYSSAIVQLYGAVTFSGSGLANMTAAYGGELTVGYHDVNVTRAISLTYSSNTVSLGNAVAFSGGEIIAYPSQITQSGTPTGNKFQVTSAAVINSQGGTTGLFNGSAAGVQTSPGLYVP